MMKGISYADTNVPHVDAENKGFIVAKHPIRFCQPVAVVIVIVFIVVDVIVVVLFA